MPSWKRVIVSGSSAHLNQITGSGQAYFESNVDIGPVRLDSKLGVYHNADDEWVALFDQDHATGYGVKITGDMTGNDPLFKVMSENTTTAFRVQGNSKVGIGVNDPDHPLEIKGGNDQGLKITDASNGSIIILQPDGGGDAQALLYNSSNVVKTLLTADGNSYFIGGNVGIGTNAPGVALEVIGSVSGSSISTGSFGHLVIAKDAHIGEDVLADGDVVAYNSSDIRLKDNLQVIKGSLDKIGEINGYEFDWNEKAPGWARERGHDIGVIAQEVQKVVPEIVVERKNGYLGVDYKRLVPLLIESVKELKQEVEDLKKKVN
jgi:hypothetical protein